MMVSEWMENGNINEFVKASVGVDRLELVRSSFGMPSSLVIDDCNYSSETLRRG